MNSIVGMDSALAHAKELPPFANMNISSSLVIDMVSQIARLRAEVEAARVAMVAASKQMADFIHLANHVGINDADGFYLAAALDAKKILDAAIDAARGGK